MFTKEVIRDAIWSCDGNKSAILDEYSLEFFKKNWDLLKKELTNFMKDFHMYGTLTKA